MGFFGRIVINTMRNNLSVGIVCMTVDPVRNDNTSNNASSSGYPGSGSLLPVLFPNYARSRSRWAVHEDEDTCPQDTSDSGYGEVSRRIMEEGSGPEKLNLVSWQKLNPQMHIVSFISWQVHILLGKIASGGVGPTRIFFNA